jgi:hypothetical protein
VIGAHGLKRRMAVLAMASLAGACYSEVPLDLTPTIPVDPSLVGDWTCRAPTDGGHAVRLKVKAMDRYRYAISWQEEGAKPEKYVAFASSVGGRTLFNVRLDPPQSSRWWDHPWAFVAVGLSSGALRVQLLVDGIVSGTERSPEQLRRSFAQALGRSDVLTQEMTVCRTKN